MAITAHWYSQGLKKALTGTVDLDTDTFKGMLATSSYTPNIDTDDFRDDVSSNEITGTGYTAGGVTLSSVTVSYDSSSNEIRFDFADPAWTSASLTARYFVVYKSRGGLASADELVLYVDFGADETVASGNFSIVIDATGAGKVTVS